MMFNSLLAPNLTTTTTTTTTLLLPTSNTPLSNGFAVSTLSKGILNEMEQNKTLLNILKSSYFEKKPSHWVPSRFESITNNRLSLEFEQIKNEFKSSAKEASEYEEKFAFIVCESENQLNDICLNGYLCPDNSYNVIGQSKSGVYLCKYADVALKFNEVKRFPDSDSFKMIVFKICFGKQTLALVRKDAKLAPISATPNFNSHMSVIPPKEKDDIEVQFDHSQIYLYELDANKTPNKRPRHCLPYAVVTWQKHTDGTEWPNNFNLDLEASLDIEVKSELNGIEPEASVPLTNGNHLNNSENDSQTLTENHVKNEPDQNQKEESSVEVTNPNLGNPETINQTEIKESSDQNQEQTNLDNNSKTDNEVQSNSNNDQIKTDLATEHPNVQQQNSTEITPTVTTTTVQQTNSTPTTPAPPTTTTTTSTTYHKPASQTYFPKASAYSAYRQNAAAVQAAAMAPYLYAAAPGHQFSPYGASIRLPFAAGPGGASIQTIPAQAAAYQAAIHANQPFQAAAAAPQQQLFLCRGPNGLTYVTAAAAPNVVAQQQLAVAQAQAQANALLQQQAAAAAVLSASQVQQLPFLTKYQPNLNGALALANPQPAQQIIYQAAPQPASSAVASSQNKQNTSGANAQQGQQVQQTTSAPPTQSPKQQQQQQQQVNQAAAQQQAAVQYAGQLSQQLQLAGYQNGQPVFAYAQAGGTTPTTAQAQVGATQQAMQQFYAANTPAAQGAVATQQGYMLQQQANQLQQLQQLQQQQQQQQQQAQQQAAAAAAAAAAAQQQQQLAYGYQQLQGLGQAQAIPAGYQLIDYRQLQGGAAAVQLDQLAGLAGVGVGGVPRPRIVNLRHHPYQRP